eukprot:TRINITY_DN1787_c0_g2_i6.p1 TRINITY_DN1787_c0_g2~~TRINITY_DN1787_c0_g2_i6.p1  ORF type:complete len:319 (-),score=70.03 TRINITY_DN1787_c0_g2_i6:230-1186(-)
MSGDLSASQLLRREGQGGAATGGELQRQHIDKSSSERSESSMLEQDSTAFKAAASAFPAQLECIAECPVLQDALAGDVEPDCAAVARCDTSGCWTSQRMLLNKVVNESGCDWRLLSKAQASCTMNTSSTCSSDAACPRDVLGPSSCSEGWCLCFSRYCFTDGMCRRTGDSCRLSTSTSCPANGCMSLQSVLGPTTCNRGTCHCNDGFCFDEASKKCLPVGTFPEPPHLEEGQRRTHEATSWSTANQSFVVEMDGAEVGKLYAAICINLVIFIGGAFATASLVEQLRRNALTPVDSPAAATKASDGDKPPAEASAPAPT